MNKRIEWIDVAKAILIFLVVLGHSPIPQWECNAINSFHMAAFFTLSGFTFSYKGNLKEFLIKKVRSILVPYIEFSVILLCFFFVKSTFLHSGNFDILEGLKSMIIPISGRDTTSVYGLWFLPCLFLSEVAIAIFMDLKSRYKIFSSILFAIVLLALCLISYLYFHVASVLSVLPIAVFFIILGTLLKRVMRRSFIALCLNAIVLVLCIYMNTVWLGYNVDMSSMYLGFVPLYIISGITGALFICYIAQYLTRIPYIQQFGKDSLYIYGLHYVVISLISSVLTGVSCAIVVLLVTLPIVYVFKKFRSLNSYL